MEKKTALALALAFAAINSTAATGNAASGTRKPYKDLSGEDQTKMSLGVLRTTISMYRVDEKGRYPPTLEALIGPKYLTGLLKIRAGTHERTNAWTPYGAEACTGSTVFGAEIDATKINDTGGWGYVTDPKAKCYGKAFVDCTHKGSKGKRWLTY